MCASFAKQPNPVVFTGLHATAVSRARSTVCFGLLDMRRGDMEGGTFGEINVIRGVRFTVLWILSHSSLLTSNFKHVNSVVLQPGVEPGSTA